MASHYARKTGKVDDAVPYLERAIKESIDNGLVPNNYVFELGSCYYMKLDWTKSAEIFEGLISDDKNEFELKPFCALHLCSCLLMMDREEEAFALLTRVPSLVLNKGNRQSKIALARTERILQKKSAPFIAFEFLYLKRDLAHMEKATLEKALEILDQIVQKVPSSDSDSLAAYHLIKGTILKLVGRSDEAMVSLDYLIEIRNTVKVERYSIPFGYWEKGELLYHKGYVKEAEAAFAAIQAYKGPYDVSHDFALIPARH